MRTQVLALAAMACGAVMAMASPAEAQVWNISYQKAAAESEKTGKPILADFTGSDWCGWCMKLHSEVFATPAFQKWAKDNVVLLVVDFPQSRQLPAAQAKQNAELKTKYAIRGYPTILFLDSTGTVLGRSGYVEGGAANWVKNAQAIIDKAPKPQPLTPMEDLAAAQAAAQKDNKPLLVFVYASKTASVKAAFEAMLKNPGVKGLAERVVVAQVDSSSAGSENMKALDALRDKLKLRKDPLHVFAADVAGEKVLYSTNVIPRTEAMTEQLGKALPVPAYEGGWLEDIEKAKAVAASLKRPMLLDFTGSDWCGWCKKVDAEIFSTDDFSKYASGKLVLVKVDFPRGKKLPEKIETQNRALAQKYGVQGYPTMVLISAAGAEQGRLDGFPKGGLEAFMAWLKSKVKA